MWISNAPHQQRAQAKWARNGCAPIVSTHWLWSMAVMITGALAPHVFGQASNDGQAPVVGNASEDVPSTDAPSDSTPTRAKAHELLNGGDYRDAIEAFRSLTATTGEGALVAVGLAETHAHIGEYEEALEVLQNDVALANADALVVRSLIRVTLGKYEEAERDARAAIALNKNHAGARRALAELLFYLGRRAESIAELRWFDRVVTRERSLRKDAAWLTHVGVGLLRYSVLTQTNVADRTRYVLQDVLQQAYSRVDRSYLPARIAAADLLRRRHNNSEEDGSVSDYLATLEINEHYCPAIIGLGEVLLEGWQFEKVEKHAERALKINPKYPPALHLLARKLILERRYDQARTTCDRALTLNDRDLVALSLQAAAAACQYDQDAVAELENRVRGVNPRCASFYQTQGDALGGIRQYEASERAYIKAIELDPTNANTRNELGMMYMQWGLEDKARDTLDAAWLLDPFNQKTKNTLDLLDSLAQFDVYESAHFQVRYDGKLDVGIGRRIADYMETVYEEVVGDYEHPLAHRTIIEVFPTQAAFAVRITGKPWIHTVGACTGRVIALASPRESAQLTGAYNLASVLKHEFTHTVTLAATNNRIPHWFTEGLAVWQENSDRSFHWCTLLADAVRRGELFTLESIDWAFIRPKRPSDRQMAYAQSEWMCEYIGERFGYDSINEMIGEFRAGHTVDSVFRETLGIAPAAFDEAFSAWAREDARVWKLNLSPPEDVEPLRKLAGGKKDAALLGRLARAEWDAGNEKTAYDTARKALELDAVEVTSLDVASKILMRAAERTAVPAERAEYRSKALPLLRRLWDADAANVTAPRYLAKIALDRKELESAIEPLRRLQTLCPLDPMSWRGLGGIYLQRGDRERALPQLMELARVDQNDARVRFQLGKMYGRLGRFPDAQYWYREALYIEPFNVTGNNEYAQVSLRAGDDATALQTYDLLTGLEPGNVHHWEHAAQAAMKMGDRQRATDFARKAVDLNPDSPVAALIQTPPGQEPKE